MKKLKQSKVKICKIVRHVTKTISEEIGGAHVLLMILVLHVLFIYLFTFIFFIFVKIN